MNVTIDLGQILFGSAQLITVLLIAYNTLQGNKRDKAIDAIHKATNSMKDALVASTEKESFARGVKSGELSSMNLNHRKPDKT